MTETAADLLGGTSGADGGSGGDPNAGGDGGSGAEGGQVEGGADPDWYNSLSAEGDAENASNRDYVKSKGFKDLDSLTKAYRAAEKSLHDKGMVKVPGEGATAEEVASYHRAIGVPEKPDGYKLPALKDAQGNDVPMNSDKLAFIAEKAHARGIPAAALEGILQDIAEHDTNELAGQEIELTKKAEAHAKSWGAEKDAKLDAVEQIVSRLNLTKPELLSLRVAWGPERALDVLAELGAGIREDTLVSGDKRQRFAGDVASAQRRLDEIKTSADLREKAFVPGSALNVEYNRLLDIVAQDADRKAREDA